MATELVNWRDHDRRVYLITAIVFPLIVLAGFAPTYYLKFAFGDPPLPSLLVHLHGAVMTLWVLFFLAQVSLIRTKKTAVHIKMGLLGIVLACVVLIVGMFTAVAAAKRGGSPLGTTPLAFLAVPFFDMIMFAGLFGAAIWYRKRPQTHKRMMMLTVINFLPPAIARIPLPVQDSPIYFFGVPALITAALLVYDWRKTGNLNRPFLIGALLLIASYPLRLLLSGTAFWASFASWLTGWAA